MNVLIAAKEETEQGIGVWGIFEDGRLVQLLDSAGRLHPHAEDIRPGEVYNLDFRENPNAVAPHKEGILVGSMKYASVLPAGFSLGDFIKNNALTDIWRGNPEELFGGMIQWSFWGTGFVPEKGPVPDHSIGFWLSDKALSVARIEDHVYYIYYISPEEGFYIPYHGKEIPLPIIHENTLVRVSLSGWESTRSKPERHCRLQISGWYL